MKIITAQALKEKGQKEELFLLDVREKDEWQSGFIQGACLLPLGILCLEKLSCGQKPIVIYCRSGKRSLLACLKILEQDPTLDVASLEGGILAWQENGFPISQG